MHYKSAYNLMLSLRTRIDNGVEPPETLSQWTFAPFTDREILTDLQFHGIKDTLKIECNFFVKLLCILTGKAKSITFSLCIALVKVYAKHYLSLAQTLLKSLPNWRLLRPSTPAIQVGGGSYE